MDRNEQIKQGRDNFARGLDWLRGHADVLLENIDEIVDDLFVQADRALDAMYERALAEQGEAQPEAGVESEEEVFYLMMNDLAAWSEHINHIPEGTSSFRGHIYEPKLFAQSVNAWNTLEGDFKSKSVHDWLNNNG